MKTIFERTGVLYLAAAITLCALVDMDKADLRRSDALEEGNACYPVLLNAGKEAYDPIKLHSVLRYYKLLGKVNPNSRADEMIGYCYFLLKDFRRSRASFEKDLKVYPQHFWVRYDLALVEFQQGDYGEAAKIFEDITKEDSELQSKNAVLSLLRKLPNRQRQDLFDTIADFVLQVKDKSGRLALLGYACSKKDQQALAAAAAVTANLSPWLVAHPWSYTIPPGKELLLN